MTGSLFYHLKFALLGCLVFLCLSSCGFTGKRVADNRVFTPVVSEATVVERYAPSFLIYGYNKEHNRIGTPEASVRADGEVEVGVNPACASVYYRTETFDTEKDTYTNLYYRVYFRETPFSLVPFHLTAGKSPGLLVVVTLNGREDPVLVTTVHTCGCYLSIIPTEYMPRDRMPDGYVNKYHWVYGEELPGMIEFGCSRKARLLISVKGDIHRVTGICATEDPGEVMNGDGVIGEIIPAAIFRHDRLRHLPAGDVTVSFYHEKGSRRGYVKGAIKPWETFLLGLIAMDPRVGTDKSMGVPGRPFYTSLKPWNRHKSDMNDFPQMMKFWGWHL